MLPNHALFVNNFDILSGVYNNLNQIFNEFGQLERGIQIGIDKFGDPYAKIIFNNLQNAINAYEKANIIGNGMKIGLRLLQVEYSKFAPYNNTNIYNTNRMNNNYNDRYNNNSIRPQNIRPSRAGNNNNDANRSMNIEVKIGIIIIIIVREWKGEETKIWEVSAKLYLECINREEPRWDRIRISKSNDGIIRDNALQILKQQIKQLYTNGNGNGYNVSGSGKWKNDTIIETNVKEYVELNGE